ncbi:MAG: hypothetical protein K2G40_01335 [Muribaculaceae bacterium]|nr:hypothetical protein [Muribaculaceae bacterium]
MTAVNDNSGSLVSGSVATLLGVGGGLMVASIPFIVLFHKYSKRAQNIEINMNLTMINSRRANLVMNIPALGFTLTF